MSEALTVVEVGEDRLLVPVGSTPKQVKLARLVLRFDPERDTWTALMQEAGYSLATALASARRTLESAGVQRATTALRQSLVDNARSLMALGMVAFETAEADLKGLEPRDRLAAGLKFVETAHATGENIEQSGNADDWTRRVHRAVQRGMRLTEQRLALPPDQLLVANERLARRRMERMSQMLPRRRSVTVPTTSSEPSYTLARTKAREMKVE